MIEIDLLITKNNRDTTLSSENIIVQDVDYSSTNLDVDRRSVKNRSGYIHAGTRYGSKIIKATGKIKVSSLQEYHQVKDKLNGMLVDADPYYITPILPLADDLYEFESPGESEGDIDLSENGFALGYRFKVVCENGFETNFLGKYSGRLLFSFYVEFITAELPFGQTIPRDFDISSKNFLYGGTAINSQLEYPWELKLVASQNQTGKFTINFDGIIYEYNSNVPINIGDTFIIGAIETIRNDINVTEYTNYQYFELRPLWGDLNSISTDFVGNIEILNYVEFFK